MTKALVYELGKSISFGRLSLPGKVLWPMLLAASDDQGRGLAEPDVIAWYVCPNVAELTVENIPAILQEMAEQEMLCLYEDSRGRKLYQVVWWWSYQKMQWAQPSKYESPDGWTDRVRMNVRGDGYIDDGWDTTGGFEAKSKPKKPPGDKPEGAGENPPGEPPGATKQPNSKELNSTESKETESKETELPKGADAPLPHTLNDWFKFIEEGQGQGGGMSARVGRMAQTLYPKYEPNYGRIGRAAKWVKGYSRLAHLLWMSQGYKVTGDPIDYCEGMHKGKAGETKEPYAGIKEWVAEQEAVR